MDTNKKEVWLLKKRFYLVWIVVLFIVSSLAPDLANADSEMDKLKQQLEQIKAEQKAAQAKANKTQQELTSVQIQQANLRKEIQTLDLKMGETEKDINLLSEQIKQTEAEAMETAVQLEAAIQRVEERDELLKARVRAMYETGEVSYLEVLMDSRSIGDFLSRLDMVERIVNSDVAILEQNKQDQAEIEQRKAEIDAYKEALTAKYADLEKALAALENQQKEKSVRIATLEATEEDLEKEQEALDQALAQLAVEFTKKNQQLQKLYYTGGELAWPLPDSNRITSPFGYRIHPIRKTRSLHTGLDIAAKSGTDIVAAEGGEVILAEYYGGNGNTVMISHGGGMVTMYAHIRNGGIKVKVGDVVQRGQKIAEVGSTGLSTGPHLHFSVLKDGKYLDPMKFFGK